MKPPSEWTEKDLYDLPIGEFDWLEVKGRRALDLTDPQVKEPDIRANLSKALSAFANTEGGTLVIGLKNPKDHWAVDEGGIPLQMGRRSTREWLEDIIPQLADYPLTKFNVYVIRASGNESQIAPDRGVFLITLPTSDDAPHQASDQRYYARVGGKSRPIGQRLVADIFNRAKHPSLSLEFTLLTEARTTEASHPLAGYKRKTARYTWLEVTATNVGRVLAHFVHVIVTVPTSWLESDDRDDQDERPYHFRNTRQDVVGVEVSSSLTARDKYGPSWFDPLLPGLTRTWSIHLQPALAISPLDGEARWSAHADSAPQRTGRILGATLLAGLVTRTRA